MWSSSFIVASIFVFSIKLQTSCGDKGDAWPPPFIYDTYDVKGIVQTCVTESNVDPSQIEKFEKTRDLKNLPDSRELRCYMYCLLRQWGYMKEGSSDTHPEALLEFLERIQPHEFDRYTAMNKKCGNKIKEPCDKAYALNKCWKSNSPEFYYTFY